MSRGAQHLEPWTSSRLSSEQAIEASVGRDIFIEYGIEYFGYDTYSIRIEYPYGYACKSLSAKLASERRTSFAQDYYPTHFSLSSTATMDSSGFDLSDLRSTATSEAQLTSASQPAGRQKRSPVHQYTRDPLQHEIDRDSGIQGSKYYCRYVRS